MLQKIYNLIFRINKKDSWEDYKSAVITFEKARKIFLRKSTTANDKIACESEERMWESRDIAYRDIGSHFEILRTSLWRGDKNNTH